MDTTTKITTGRVRFSYVNVFKPRAAVEGQKEKYSACIAGVSGAVICMGI